MVGYVLVSILVVGIMVLFLVGIWIVFAVKHGDFSDQMAKLNPIKHIGIGTQTFNEIAKSRTWLWISTIIVTILVIGVVVAYFIISKGIFLNNHEHNYEQSIIKEATCYAEGTLRQKCRYCDESYEETIAAIEHRYVETNHHDATCTMEGIVEYTCEMCADVKMAAIPLKNHQYAEYVEQKPSCATEGIVAKQCKNCDHTVQETIPVNDNHHYKQTSYVPAAFWKSGYERYTCQDCGGFAFSPQVKSWNVYVVIAIVILVISVVIIVSNGFDTGISWASLVVGILAACLLVFHWGWIIPPQTVDEPHTVPLIQKLLIAPADHALVELERVESTYTQHGTVTYECADCADEFTEYLVLREIDLSYTPQYSKPAVTDKKEKEKNNSFNRATEIPVHTRVTGNLSNYDDVDYFKVVLPAAGSIKFVFTDEGNQYMNHWNATIYDSDKSTVLAKGYIDKTEFGYGNLEAGTYYLKISVITGGNPIMNAYSDADYHIMFVPACTEHTHVTQYFSKTPTCGTPVDITTVCDICQSIIAVDNIGEMEHRWDEWEIKNTGTAISMEKRERTCVLCGETETLRRAVYWWVIPLLVFEVLSLVFCAVLVFNESERCVIPVLMHLLMGTAVAATLRQIPFFDGGKVDAIILGVLLSIHLLLMSESVYVLAQDWRRRCYRYSTLPTVFFVIGLLLMFLVGPLLDAITCVILALVMGVYAGGLAFVALFDDEKGHAFWDIIVAIGNLAVAVIYMFRI